LETRGCGAGNDLVSLHIHGVDKIGSHGRLEKLGSSWGSAAGNESLTYGKRLVITGCGGDAGRGNKRRGGEIWKAWSSMQKKIPGMVNRSNSVRAKNYKKRGKL